MTQDNIRSLKGEEVTLVSFYPAQAIEYRRAPQGFQPDLMEKAVAIESAKTAPLLTAPKLEAPSTTSPQPTPDQAMKYLVNAFCDTFDSMAQGTTQEVNNLGNLQQLDATMSKMVVQATNDAITEQLQAVDLTTQINSQIDDINSKSQGVYSWLNWIGMGLVAVVTILASIPTDGAADAALPEELSGMGGSDAGADAADDAAFNGDATIDITSVSEGEAEIQSVESEAEADVASDESVENDNSEPAKQPKESAPKPKSNVLKDMTDWVGKKVGLSPEWTEKAGLYFKRFMMATGSSMCALPMILQGYASYLVAGYQQQLADTQAKVGTATSEMQGNSMYFQFYQQVNKREGDLVQSLVEQTGDMVTLIGGIMNGYGQIPGIVASSTRN